MPSSFDANTELTANAATTAAGIASVQGLLQADHDLLVAAVIVILRSPRPSGISLLQLSLDGLDFSSSIASTSHSISILRPSDTPSTLFLFLGDDENRYTSSPPNPMVRPPVFPQQQPPHSRLPCPLRSTTPGRSEPRTPPPPPPPPPFSFLAHLTCLRLPHLFFMSRLPNCTTLH